MKHRLIALLFVVIAILPTAISTASANSAPDPDFIIHFSGVEGSCYMTLLYKEKPDEDDIYHVSEDGKRDPEIFDYGLYGHRMSDDVAEPVFQRFFRYEDPDGYYFVQCMADVSDGKSFYENLYYPKEFKVLLYFPDSGVFISSEKLEAKSYFNCFNVAVENGKIVSVTRSSEIAERGMSVSNFLYIFFLTIQTVVIEFLIALLFRFKRGRQLVTVLVVNLLTHPLMIGLMMVINPPINGTVFSPSIILFEIGVTVAEMLVYLWLFPKFETERKVNRWLIAAYAVAANLVTYFISALVPETILGWVISRLY